MGVVARRAWAVVKVGVGISLGASLLACAHAQPMPARAPQIAAGRYAVESIRSRASVGGQDKVIELSMHGTRIVDASGKEHVLAERGALLLDDGGRCRLALAVSVDGDEPGVSDRPCTWAVQGDQFVLGDLGQGTRTTYKVSRKSGRVVLEGLQDLGPDGKVTADATDERIVLFEVTAEPKQADSTPSPHETLDGSELTSEL